MRGARRLGLAASAAIAASTPGPARTHDRAAPPPLVVFVPNAAGVAIAGAGRAADIVVAPGDHAVVALAAADLRRDVERVAGVRPRLLAAPGGGGGDQVWAGTLGRSPAIDALARSGRIDVARLRACWECFDIAVVERPAQGVARALVIVGSDRRGTAYGLYELSQAIGVSPWHWWADVAPLRHATLVAPRGLRRFGPPSVRYRGIFLNDEDWGLAPWAAGTFEPEAKGIGPRTYARVFDLMLRLKANTVWPAMHPGTPPFNADPADPALADRYAIIMGSSHAEPMLRDNVGEWHDAAGQYDYSTNPAGVAAYWRERVAANARFENIWTLGMRGIHDSAMQGPRDEAGRRALLERIIADQRAMLTALVDPKVEGVPQVFTPYKEVLDLYRGGLRVPGDVTLMWPDDNFGYVRHVPDAAERARPGGSGVYYHLSYLGAPLSYLWLSTTPPGLIAEELGRAWDGGARTIWMLNVGDLKPAELDIDYAMRLAWDVPGTRAEPLDAAVARWAARDVDAGLAPRIAALLAAAQRLNVARRPEHLQWWLPGERPRPSPYTTTQADARVAAFAALAAEAHAMAPLVAPERRDALFELVTYPVVAAWLANRRVFAAEAHDALRYSRPMEAARRGEDARAAERELAALTRRYNDEVAGGKWRGIMAVEPADGQWRQFRLTPPILPAPSPLADRPPAAPAAATVAMPEATPIVVAATAARPASSWRRVDGIGRGGAAAAAGGGRARLAYPVRLPPGRWQATVAIVPTYPTRDGAPLRIVAAIDGGAPATLEAPRRTGDRAWAQAVLDNRISLAVPGAMGPGRHEVTLTLDDPAVLVEELSFVPMLTPAPGNARRGE